MTFSQKCCLRQIEKTECCVSYAGSGLNACHRREIIEYRTYWYCIQILDKKIFSPTNYIVVSRINGTDVNEKMPGFSEPWPEL